MTNCVLDVLVGDVVLARRRVDLHKRNCSTKLPMVIRNHAICRDAIGAGTGSSGRRANPAANLERLVGALMEPVGREARRRAAESVRGTRR